MDITFIVLFALLGTLLGCICGLIPGIHVNTLALILLSASPVIASQLESFGIYGYDALLLISVTVVSCSIAQTFLNFIPATFLGAPDDDTALVLLPGHSMLLKGRGYEACALSAIGSFGAIVVGFCALIPFAMILGPPLNLYGVIRTATPFILIGISSVLILSELPRGLKCVGYAAMVFALSGTLGFLALPLPSHSPFGLPSSILFPILTGLFGVSTLLLSLKSSPTIPPQRMDEPKVDVKECAKSVMCGSFFGSMMGFLPGVTAAQATVISMLARRNKGDEQVIVTLSSVNTAVSFFVLATLFLLGRARSGAAIVVRDLIPIERWVGLSIPEAMIYLLMAVIISSCAGYYATKILGKRFALIFGKIPYNHLSISVISLLIILSFVFCGPIGLLVLGCSVAIGLIPPLFGVKRVHCMGVLLLPIIVWMMS